MQTIEVKPALRCGFQNINRLPERLPVIIQNVSPRTIAFLAGRSTTSPSHLTNPYRKLVTAKSRTSF